MTKSIRVFSLFSAAFLTLQPFVAMAQTTTVYQIPEKDLAAGFNPNLILDDADLFELKGMTLPKLQQFLESKSGVLAKRKIADIDGVEKPVADIVWRVATSYAMSPRYLLALMQKEQSLVEDPNPTQKQFDWAMGYGVCDSCSMDDPAIQNFKGFASQVEWAAKQHREKYLQQILGRGTTISGKAPGKATTINGMELVIANQATAMLYSYTPHIHGNLNLWRIWQRWFGFSLPEGTFVRSKTTNKYYLIRFGTKRPIKNRTIAASLMDLEKYAVVEESQLSTYPLGEPISFPNYSLVETPDGKRYLLAGNEKRLIASKAVFKKFAFNEDEVLEATPDELLNYKDGPDITASTTYPTGLLAKDAKGALWYVENNTRSLIPSKAFANLYFKGRTAKLLPAATLQKLEIGNPYRLRDGELVRSDKSPAVYVIENGGRRPIVSGEVFETLGWQWKNVVTLPETILTDYAVGEPVTLQKQATQVASTQ